MKTVMFIQLLIILKIENSQRTELVFKLSRQRHKEEEEPFLEDGDDEDNEQNFSQMLLGAFVTKSEFGS